MKDFILSLITGKTLAVSVAIPAFLYLMKRIPNEMIKKYIGSMFYGIGVACTLGMSKWIYTAKIWNKTIEVYFIDLLDNTIGIALAKFIEGLRSDNPGN